MIVVHRLPCRALPDMDLLIAHSKGNIPAIGRPRYLCHWLSACHSGRAVGARQGIDDLHGSSIACQRQALAIRRPGQRVDIGSGDLIRSLPACRRVPDLYMASISPAGKIRSVGRPGQGIDLGHICLTRRLLACADVLEFKVPIGSAIRQARRHRATRQAHRRHKRGGSKQG